MDAVGRDSGWDVPKLRLGCRHPRHCQHLVGHRHICSTVDSTLGFKSFQQKENTRYAHVFGWLLVST